MENYWHKLDPSSLIQTLSIGHQLLLLLLWRQPHFLPDSLCLKGGWTLGGQVDFSNLSVPLTFPASLTPPLPPAPTLPWMTADSSTGTPGYRN